MMKLKDKGIEHHMFHEPDNNMGYTAIATEPIYGKDRKFFRKFKMYEK